MRRIAPLLIGAAIAVLAAAGFAEQQEKERQVCPITWLTAPQTHDEAEFITLTNADRRKLGLRPLALDPTLQQVARTHSWEMYAKDYFDHRSPSAGQRTPMDRYLKGGGSYRRRIIVGENLYYCTRADVQRGHALFVGAQRLVIVGCQFASYSLPVTYSATATRCGPLSEKVPTTRITPVSSARTTATGSIARSVSAFGARAAPPS